MPLTTVGRNTAANSISSAITHVSLHTANPGASGASEVSGTGYARATTSGSDWTESTGVSSNNATIRFPFAAADWGTATHFAVWGTVGMIAWGALASSVQLDQGSQLSISAGSLTLTIPAGTI